MRMPSNGIKLIKAQTRNDAVKRGNIKHVLIHTGEQMFLKGEPTICIRQGLWAAAGSERAGVRACSAYFQTDQTQP
jgi:hypothetical protein